MKKEYNCPTCERILISSSPRLSLLDTRAFGELIPGDVLIEVTTDYECLCETTVTIRDVIHYTKVI